MNEKIKAGQIFGTVDNQLEEQVSYICDLLNSILKKNTAEFEKVWYSKPKAIGP